MQKEYTVANWQYLSYFDTQTTPTWAKELAQHTEEHTFCYHNLSLFNLVIRISAIEKLNLQEIIEKFYTLNQFDRDIIVLGNNNYSKMRLLEIVQKVFLETGINIQIISGDFEASLIYESHIAETLDQDTNYLYVDVGGGSTELTLISKGKLIFKQSFNIGTIRLLKNQVSEADWDYMKQTLKDITKDFQKLTAIGTGGNINKVFSLSKRKDGKPLDLDLLRAYYKEFSSCSLEERIQLYQFRADRADVIVPALLIYTQVMKWSSINEILVPKIGLVDGLIQHLYEELAV
jgi:hypothetical protein